MGNEQSSISRCPFYTGKQVMFSRIRFLWKAIARGSFGAAVALDDVCLLEQRQAGVCNPRDRNVSIADAAGAIVPRPRA